jgi:peptide/nickel transport system permease protein
VSLRWAPPAALAGWAAVAVAGRLLVPESRLSAVDHPGPVLAPPGPGHLWGTDENGVSVLALTVAGARQSLAVGLVVTTLALGVGGVVGLVAGSLRGLPDRVLMLVTEWFVVLPQVPVAVVTAGVLGAGLGSVALAITLTSWAGTARVVRAGVLTAQARPHVERIRALGAGPWHLAREHLLPEVAPVLAATGALTLANALLVEAALSFLGAGGPRTSWGAMLRSATTSGAVTAGAWWYLLAPGLAIMTVVLAAAGCARTADGRGSRRGP